MENYTNRLSQHRVATNPHFVKKLLSAKCNKTRYACVKTLSKALTHRSVQKIILLVGNNYTVLILYEQLLEGNLIQLHEGGRH